MRVALYYRVSTEEQALEGHSIPAQRKILTDYAIREGWEVVAEYADEGESARTDDRPEFQRMIAEAKQKPRPFDVILVHKYDRFARNREDSIVYKKILRKDLGIDVVSISEPVEDGPVGMLMEGILELLAEYYSINLAQEVKKGMKQGASSGKAMGMAPLGYRVGESGNLTIVPEDARVVKWIFDMYTSEAIGLRGLAIELRENGAQLFGEPGTRFNWSAPGLRAIIVNPAYVGRLVWNRRDSNKGHKLRPSSEWVSTDNAHEALISLSQWEEANQILSGRKRPRSPKTEYLLYGMVRCMECGGSLSKQYMTWTANGQRIKRDCLRCTRNTHSGTCYFNYIWMDDIEQAVFQYLQDILDGRISGQELSVSNPNSPITSTERELDSSRKELARLSEKFDRQVVAYENGILDIEQLRQAKSRLENDKSAITRRIQELEKVLATGTKVIPIGDIRTNLTRVLAIAQNTSVPIPERRAALAEVIDVITYSKNHDLLRITLKA